MPRPCQNQLRLELPPPKNPVLRYDSHRSYLERTKKGPFFLLLHIHFRTYTFINILILINAYWEVARLFFPFASHIDFIRPRDFFADTYSIRLNEEKLCSSFFPLYFFISQVFFFSVSVLALYTSTKVSIFSSLVCSFSEVVIL